MDPSFLDQILQAFTSVLTGGFLRVHPWVMATFTILATTVMVVVLSIYFLRPHPISLVMAAGLILRIAVLSAIATNWLYITDAMMNSFVALGLQVGGSSLTPAELLSPGTVLVLGLRLTDNLMNILGDWGMDALWAPWIFIIYSGVTVIIWMAFSILAASILLSVVEYQVVNLYAFLVFPLMPVSFVAWISWGLVRAMAGAALRLGGLAIFLSISLPFFVGLALPGEGDITVQSALVLAIGTGILAYMVWRGLQMLGASAWPGAGLVQLGMLTWMGLRRM